MWVAAAGCCLSHKTVSHSRLQVQGLHHHGLSCIPLLPTESSSSQSLPTPEDLLAPLPFPPGICMLFSTALPNIDKDIRPLAFVRFNTSLGRPKPVTIKALLDSGASESLINKKYVSKLRVKNSNKTATVWSTQGGDLHTSSQVKGQFTIPELQDKKLIEWNLQRTWGCMT
jgi:Aspartyl protease